jgi:hypothetical protein
VQSIRKTYEQIVKRLKEERVGFDNQLAAIERTLKAKEKDLEELVLMSHDAQHAKEVRVCVCMYVRVCVCVYIYTCIMDTAMSNLDVGELILMSHDAEHAKCV